MRYSRQQRRHDFFVLVNDGKFLKFAPDGNNYGFVEELESANAFKYSKAVVLKEVIKAFDLDIKRIAKYKGDYIAI